MLMAPAECAPAFRCRFVDFAMHRNGTSVLPYTFIRALRQQASASRPMPKRERGIKKRISATKLGGKKFGSIKSAFFLCFLSSRSYPAGTCRPVLKECLRVAPTQTISSRNA